MANMSGIGAYIRNLVPLCIKDFPQVTFRLITGAPLPFALQKNAVAVHAASTIYSLHEQLELPLLVRGTKGLWSPHYAFPLAAPVPVLVTVHDLAHLALPKIFGKVQRLYARLLFTGVLVRARGILFNSRFTEAEFQKFVGTPNCKTAVTPLGIAPEWFQHVPAQTTFPFPYFLAVGNLKPHKNLLILCRAFAEICGQIPQHLVLAGKKTGFINGIDGPSIEEMAPGKIYCTDEISFDLLHKLMAGATALVFPSLYEGFGFPPLEAMACGTPVIASDIPPIRETCGTNATYIVPYSQISIREALLHAAHDAVPPDTAKNLQAHAKNFSWEKTAEKTSELIQNLFSL